MGGNDEETIQNMPSWNPQIIFQLKCEKWKKNLQIWWNNIIVDFFRLILNILDISQKYQYIECQQINNPH